MTSGGFMVRRIKAELKDIASSEETASCGISVQLANDQLTELKGLISGPPGTPYEGGNFNLEIKVPENYPYKPLKILFITKIWHPNISPVTGKICLDTLGNSWTPSLTLRTVLLSLQSLLSIPEPDDPLNAIVAAQCKEDPEMFNHTAKHWTQVYAGAPGTNPDFEKKIELLMNMGLDEDRARTTLSFSSWDVEKAVDFVFS